MDVEQKMTGELDGRKRVCVSCWITKYLATLCSQGKCMVKPITLREYFLMNHHNQNTLMNVPERNRFVQAIQHEVGVASDMQTLSKFVREQIFYVFVHDFKDDKDDCLSSEGEVCQEFIESYFDVDHKESILNPCLQDATDEERRAYLKWLWKEGLKPTTRGRGNIRRDLSNEKSAVYASISEAFKSEWNK